MKFILGTKIGMSQIFDKTGKIIPVTLVAAGPCQVLQIKTKEKDKYEALQMGFVKKTKKIKKTEKGKEFKYVREQKTGNIEQYKVGDEINVSTFQEGDKVRVLSVSKGKGFQGAVKRHGFKGKKTRTHGTKHEVRGLGSTGMAGHMRVMKGRRMPGRMGSQRTMVNLTIAKIDKENNLLAIKGAVPGTKGTLLEIRG